MLRRHDAAQQLHPRILDSSEQKSNTLTFADLSKKQRLMLASDAVNAHVLTTDEKEVNLAALIDAGCSPSSIIQAEITVHALCKEDNSKDTLKNFQKLGFDATHLLSEEGFVQQLIRQFGARMVSKVFVRTASDAIAVAGSVGMQLKLTTNDLLKLCSGQPDAASAVLKFHGVDGSILYDTLLATRMRVSQMQEGGLHALTLTQQYGVTVPQLHSLGFDMRL